MLRRRDVLALTAVGALAACGNTPGGSPESGPAWPGDLPVAAGGWQELPTPPMSPRRAPTLTWTGTELLVTGGTGPVVGPTVSCPPTADCIAPPTAPLEGSGAWDPRTGVWRAVPGVNSFHHGTTWTGRLLTDGWSWLDPATGASGQAPQSDLLVYAPASWSGTEVLCVGTDGSGQPVPHTLWAWNPATGATRTSRVPAPDSGETCSTLWAGEELFVGLTQLPDASAREGVQAYDPAADRWRTVRVAAAPPSVPLGGWDGRRLLGIGRDEHDVPRLDRVDPADGTSSPLELPAALRTPSWGQVLVTAPGRVAVGVAGRLAVLDGDGWTALPDLPEPADGDSLTAAWAGAHLVVWDDAVRRTGWSFAVA